jgi:hypothetical protein
VAAAFSTAEQHGERNGGFSFGQEVPQASGKDRDGAAATMLEDQQVAGGFCGHGLQAEKAHLRILNKVISRGPRAFACPADPEGVGRVFDPHSLIIGSIEPICVFRVLNSAIRCHPLLPDDTHCGGEPRFAAPYANGGS